MTDPDPTPDEPGIPTGADDLVSVLDHASEAGFEEQFIATSSGSVVCGACRNELNPSALTVDHVDRLEGASDAADMMLVARMTCPVCGAKGVLTAGYGPNASEADAAVVPYLDISTADRD